MSLIYLAHPIDFADDTTIVELAESMRNTLLEAGATAVFSPAQAFAARLPMHANIQAINMQALSMCDGMVAFLPHGTTTLGVPFEVCYAHMQGIPTVIIRGSNQYDAQRAAKESALLAYLQIPVYGFDQLYSAASNVIGDAVARQYNDI
jgi:nucleoside 2-deoxyribosyltransferase